MKQEQTVYRSTLEIDAIRAVLRENLSGKISVSPLQYDALDDPDDFAILIEKRTMASNAAVQLHANDRGEHRTVAFVALGDGGFSTMVQVASTSGFNKGNVKLGKSRQLVDEMVQALSRRDTSVRKIA